MPLISKQNIYPQDTNVTPQDYLLGTDRGDNKKTKTYSIASIGAALGMAGVKVQEAYLGFCPISVDEVSLEEQVNHFLSIHSIQVDFNTLMIFKVLYYTGSDPSVNTRQINYYFTAGAGNYNPISSAISFSDLIVDYEKPVSFDLESAVNSPDAQVFDLTGVSGELLVGFLNNSGPYDLSDNSKTYYFRFTDNDVQYLYVFNANSSENGYGIYGSGQLQFNSNELVLIFNSTNNYEIPNIYRKKIELAENNVTGEDIININLNSEQTSFRILSDEINTIELTVPSTEFLSSIAYTGMPLIFINSTATDKKFIHSTASYGFRFPDEVDFILRPKEVIVFRLAKTDVAYFEFTSISRVELGSNTSKLLSVGAITVAGNTVSVASASALILGVEVINTEGISFMVPFATTGKIRIDLVVLNSDGDLLRISGTETDSGNIAVPPINLVPATSVIVTQINVTDADLATIIPTYLSFDEEQAIHNASSPSASNPFATVNDTNLLKVLLQGDRPIRMSDGDGDTILELDDRGKLVYNIHADFLHLPAELHPDTSVLKIHNVVDSELFFIPTDDVPYAIIGDVGIDEFTGITLKKGTAVLKKVNDFEWLLTYEISDFSKEALDLGFVDNTADINKPVSNPQAAAIKYLNSLTVHLAVDVNVSTLSGAMIIQGWGTGDSVPILLMAQTDQTQNGLWITKYDGAWTRPYQHYLTGLTIFSLYVSRGTYSGRTFQYSYGGPGSLIGLSEVVDSKLKPGIGSDTKSSMSQKAITDELDKRRKILYSKNNATLGSHTGNTAETVLFSIDFAGGDFEIGDWMDFMFQFTRTTTGSIISLRYRFGTTGTTSDALMALDTITSTGLDTATKRERLEFKSGNLLSGISNTFSSARSDINLSTSARTSISLNPSNAWKLTVTVNLGNASDTIICDGGIVGKTKTF